MFGKQLLEFLGGIVMAAFTAADVYPASGGTNGDFTFMTVNAFHLLFPIGTDYRAACGRQFSAGTARLMRKYPNF
jgi:hypothetical protein